LADLSLPAAPELSPGSSHPAAAVAVATLMAYAAATYGAERIPVLMANLHVHDRWETLVPAVYGVSAGAFERGWQAYLMERYGIQLDLPPVTG
jgi:hypothetical protein